MKKLLLICTSALLLTACADKQGYEEAVLTEMQSEQDIKDYKIDPEQMTKCVVELSSQNMPGLFPLDPDRLMAYQNYTKMLSMRTIKDKQKMLNELRTLFGSPQALANAHSNYTESVMECLSSVVTKVLDEKAETESEIEEEKAETTVEVETKEAVKMEAIPAEVKEETQIEATKPETKE